MGDARREPSMDDILASIKRIISDDGAAALNAARARHQPPPQEPEPAAEDVLELTRPAAEPPVTEPPPVEPVAASPAAEPTPAASPAAEPPSIVSAAAAAASRQSLAALSSVMVRPESGQAGNTLEALVSELLRPMLRRWLDAHLPALVEDLVSREIARIAGKDP